jgi:Glycosyl hydrolases family 38 N-terminal domain
VTVRLLNSVFQDPEGPAGRRDIEEFRRQLADAVFAEAGGIGGAALEYACMPLFRRGPRGLEQVVRFRLRQPLGPSDLAVSADGGEQGASAWGFLASGGALVADAFVDEVTSSYRLAFRVGRPGEDALWRGEVLLRPQRKWEISLVHHSHLDVGYTDPQEVVLRNHLQYLDSVLDLVDKTASWDEDAQFRWNIEVNWPLQVWLSERGTRDRQRMLEAVRAGRVGVGAMSLNLHTEACSIEELYEMARFAVDLRREHGLDITGAMQTDVPGAVPGLIEVLSDAGVRYLSLAHNYAGRSVPYLIGGEVLERPFYWVAPSGKRVLVWYTDTLHGNAYMEGNILGLAESSSVAEAHLPNYLLGLAERPYPFDSGTWLPEAAQVKREPYPHDLLHLRVQGMYGDNAPPSIAVPEVARDWNSRWAYPHLRVDLNEGFLRRAEERLGESLPSWQGDWADWWADGLGSAARMVSWARQAQANARVGTTLHALADVLGGSPPAPIGPRSDLYQDAGLFDEHTWGARHPWDDDSEGWGSGQVQWQRKASFARNANEAASVLSGSGGRSAALRIGRRGGLASVVVLNTTGTARTDVVKFFLPFSVVPASVDAVAEDERTGKALPTTVTQQQHADHRPAGRWLSFLAQDVPALGWARFNLVKGRPAEQEVTRTASSDLGISNGYYRVAISAERGCVSSVFDLLGSQELVNEDALLGFNSYVWDRYGTASRVDHLSGRVFSRSLDLVAGRSLGGPSVLLEKTVSELGETLTVDTRAPGCSRLVTRVALWDKVARAEIANTLWKTPTSGKESVFFAFPFSAAAAEVSYELPGAGVRQSAPCVPGSPRHMRAVRNWVGFATSGAATAWATVDAPLVQLGDIHSPYTPFPGTLPLEAAEPATVYSWALNNIWDTNFPGVQGGEMSFRYAVASARGPSASACALGNRLAEDVSAPLSANLVPPTATTPAREADGSLCAVDRPEVRLLQAMASSDGEQLVLWLNNLAAEEITAEVTFPGFEVRSAAVGTVFEEQLVEVPLRHGCTPVSLKPGETRALMIRGGWGRSRG